MYRVFAMHEPARALGFGLPKPALEVNCNPISTPYCHGVDRGPLYRRPAKPQQPSWNSSKGPTSIPPPSQNKAQIGLNEA